MFGYVAFYFKVENEEKVAYSFYESDFSKPITKEVYESIKEVMVKYYNENQFQVTSITSCTKEEYDNDKVKDKVILDWAEGEEKIRITEIKDGIETNVT